LNPELYIDDIYRRARSLTREFGNDYAQISKGLKEWLEGLPDNHPAKRHKHYSAVDERGVYFPSDIGWHGGDGPKYEVIHPVTKKPCKVPERGWMYPTKERMQEAMSQGLVHFWQDHTRVPCAKAYLKDNESTAPNSVFYRDRRGASKRLRHILQRGPTGRDVFENPKDEEVLAQLIEPVATGDSVVLDFFAGSGTTAHAVINLNRGEGVGRRFILVEMGDYFDTVLLPRIKKVTFTPEWKDGKPKRMATQEEAERSPRIVKYVRVESYEDTLNNIGFDDSSGQQALGFEDYLLQYMLKWETRASETLLNVEKLARPFCYKLHVHADGQTQEKIADVPETFNYLLGLHVQTRRVHDDDGRRYLVYRGRIDHRQVAIIWRETEGWQKANLERDKKFVAERKLTEGADEVFVNGDSFIPNAKALEPVFKARMFAAVEI
jgi:adenine-specific DNA-methyltransferase